MSKFAEYNQSSIKNSFPGDRYETPGSLRPSTLYLAMFKSRLYFFLRMFDIVRRGAKQAKKGGYDSSFFCLQSLDFVSAVEECGGRIILDGLENISSTPGPLVFISNHMSSLETVLLPSIILPRKDVAFVVKKSLADYPLFGSIIRSMKHIPLGRANPKEDLKAVTELGLNFLENGVSIVVFPQSTRNTEFIPEEFNTLGIKLAKKSGANAIPVALKTDFWGNGQVFKEFGPIRPENTVRIRFGRPFKVNGPGKDEHQHVIAFISDSLAEWRAEAPPHLFIAEKQRT